MRVLPCVGLLALSGALAGCTSTPKQQKTIPPANTRGGTSTTPFWAGGGRQPGPAAVPGVGTGTIDPVSAPGNDPEVSGILAGRLVDSFGRAPAAAFIQVTAVGDPNATPIDVETVNQGHFYVRGLQPRRTYRLVARATRDGRTIAGETQAQPPETRLLITLSEDFVTSTTPAVPGPPQGLSTPRLRGVTPARPGSTGGGPAPVAPWGGEASGSAAGPEFNPAASTRPEQIAETNPNLPPTVNVPPPPGLPSTSPSGTPGAFAPAAQSFTPAVLVTQNRVQYLALPDTDGQPWDFAQRRGRLVLLDLWGTWCGPCLQAIPELIRLQSAYGPRGLEVIGIACEKGTQADSVRRVQDVRRRIPGINYRLLLGDTASHRPVEGQFHIVVYPTLVLVDADGTILWRGEGGGQIGELEQLLKRRLAY